MHLIDSIKDPAYERLRASRTIAGRLKEQVFVIEKLEMVQAAIAAGYSIQAIYSTRPLVQELTSSAPCYQLSQGMMMKIFSHDPPSVVALAEKKECSLADLKGAKRLLVLDQIQNCQNLGMIFRSAEAFGVQGIIILPHATADLYDRNVIKASMGSFFRLPVAQSSTEEVVRFLREHAIAIISTSLEATKLLEELHVQPPLALVVGNETEGISAQWTQAADQLIAIPMKGEIQSLNVVVATSICLYYLR